MKTVCRILALASLVVGCGSSNQPRSVRDFFEVQQSELGRCCQSCTGSIRVESDGALTSSLSGAVTCHGQLTASETAAFLSLVTHADVVQALSNAQACGKGGSEEMTLNYDDGTTIGGHETGCVAAPFDQVRLALSGFVDEYCSPFVCVSTSDAGGD